MGLFFRKFQVKPNTVGFLFHSNSFVKILKPGYYEIMDWKNRYELFILPETSMLATVNNQEVLTKDNIALRFSFTIVYKITDGKKFLENFALDKPITAIIFEAEHRVCAIAQQHIRDKISSFDSETLNDRRNEIADFKTEEMEKEVSAFGISIEKAQLKDITFPKTIQDLFAKLLESKIRAKTELENARTAVAKARALKNASEMMKDDEGIRFFQMLETITKIAENGKHTFMFGDINQLTKR